MKTVPVQVYIQQLLHEEQGAKFMQILTFLIRLEMSLDMYLSAGG